MNPRRALAGLTAILPLAALLVTLAVLPPPEQVSLWARRDPQELVTGPAFTSFLLTVAVLAAVAAAATAVLQRAVPAAWSRWVIALAAAFGWGAWLLYVVIVWRVGVDGAAGVSDAWPLLALAGGALAGWAAYAVHGRRRPTPEQLAHLVPDRARVRPVRGRAVRPVQAWATQVSSRTMAVIGWGVLGTFAVTVVVLLLAGESLTLTLVVAVLGLLVGGLALAWSAVRLEVGQDGLEVRSRVVPVRLARVPAEDVAGAEVQQLDPMRWGGIGLRPLPERTSYIADHGGPGMVVYRRDGRRLALQVTEGDAAARAGARALLQAAGQRLGESSGSSSS